MSIMDEERDLVAVKKAECIGCVFLVGPMSKEPLETEKSCRKEQGCPAEHLQIVIGTNMDEQAVKLANAWRSNDPKSIAAMMEDLEGMHPRIKNEVFQRAKGKLVISNA